MAASVGSALTAQCFASSISPPCCCDWRQLRACACVKVNETMGGGLGVDFKIRLCGRDRVVFDRFQFLKLCAYAVNGSVR